MEQELEPVSYMCCNPGSRGSIMGGAQTKPVFYREVSILGRYFVKRGIWRSLSSGQQVTGIGIPVYRWSAFRKLYVLYSVNRGSWYHGILVYMYIATILLESDIRHVRESGWDYKGFTCQGLVSIWMGYVQDNRINRGGFGNRGTICPRIGNKINHKGYISSFTNIPPYSV